MLRVTDHVRNRATGALGVVTGIQLEECSLRPYLYEVEWFGGSKNWVSPTKVEYAECPEE